MWNLVQRLYRRKSFRYSSMKYPDGGIGRRPFLHGKLRYKGQETEPFKLLVDTGSDCCCFDLKFVQQALGMEVANLGVETACRGIDGDVKAYYHSAEIYILELDRIFKIKNAMYYDLDPVKEITGGALGLGVLGTNGFLDQVNLKISRAKTFEIS